MANDSSEDLPRQEQVASLDRTWSQTLHALEEDDKAQLHEKRSLSGLATVGLAYSSVGVIFGAHLCSTCACMRAFMHPREC